MITNTFLTSTEKDICVAGATESRALLLMMFCNTDTASRTITIYAYNGAGPGSDANTIVSALSIPAGDTYQWSSAEKLILGPNDKVTGISDTTVDTKLIVTSSYLVI